MAGPFYSNSGLAKGGFPQWNGARNSATQI